MIHQSPPVRRCTCTWSAQVSSGFLPLNKIPCRYLGTKIWWGNCVFSLKSGNQNLLRRLWLDSTATFNHKIWFVTDHTDIELHGIVAHKLRLGVRPYHQWKATPFVANHEDKCVIQIFRRLQENDVVTGNYCVAPGLLSVATHHPLYPSTLPTTAGAYVILGTSCNKDYAGSDRACA